MNIAILIPSLRMGGAERAATLLGDHLKKIGHKVFFFLMAEHGRNFFDVKCEIVDTHIPYPYSYSSVWDELRELVFATRSLKKYKKMYHIDVAVSFMEAYNILNILSKRKGERVYASVRTVLSVRNEFKGLIYNPNLLRYVYDMADAVISVSDGVKRDLIENYRIKSSKITTISNVSDCEVCYGDFVEDARTKDVLFVGRLDPVKQVDVIIRAFSYVCTNDETARLVIVGEGKKKAELLELSRSLGIDDKIVFTGMCKNVGGYLKKCGCFVMASKAEGFPNAMVEAMSYGVPVISTDSPGGCGEIVGKKGNVRSIQFCEYGILVPYILANQSQNDCLSSKEELLGKAILYLLNDVSMRDRYSKSSKRRSQYYMPERIFSLWDKILKI